MTDKIKLTILISGKGSNMKSLILDMQSINHLAEPVLVVADRPDALGLQFAKLRNIKTAIVNFDDFSCKYLFEKQLIRLIELSGSELICLAGFMRILSPKFITKFRNRILNIHPSILPLFKGLDTHTKALNSGMSLHGATVHLVTEELDGGPILGQGVVPIYKTDNSETLSSRVLALEHKLYPLTLRQFLNKDNEKILLFKP